MAIRGRAETMPIFVSEEVTEMTEFLGMPEISVKVEKDKSQQIDKTGRRLLVQTFIRQFAESPKEVATVWYKESAFVDANAFYQSLKNEADRLYPDKVFVFYNVNYSRSTVYLYKDGAFARETVRRFDLNAQKFNDSAFKKKKELEYRQDVPHATSPKFVSTGGFSRTQNSTVPQRMTQDELKQLVWKRLRSR